MSTADCRAGRCECAAAVANNTPGDRTVRQRTQIGHRGPNGKIVWELAPSNSWVSPRWQQHIQAKCTDPDITLGWIDGWLVHRTHPHIPELADYAYARIRWEPTEPTLFEVSA